MKNKYIIFLLSILIFSCEKAELDDIDDIIDPPTETSIEVVNSQFTVNTTIIEFEDLNRSLGGFRNSVYYTQNSNEYILFAGSSLPSITGKLHGTPTSLKKNQEGMWELHTPIGWTNIGMGGIRNTYKINPNTFLFADAAEQPLNGTGIVREENHLYIAEVSGDNINWTKIENEGYHHDVSFGDLNSDGVLDIVSASQGEIYYGTGGYNFDVVFDKLPRRYGSAYFSNEIVDVDNDGIEEIIEVSYVGSEEDVKNGFRVLKRNDNGNYDLFKKITNTKLNSNDDMGGTWIESLDLNNDGNKDLIILREGYVGGEPISGVLEIYFGDGQGNFTSNQLFNGDELGVSFVSPNLMDIDNDADLDIVFTSACMGGNCNNFPGLIPTGTREDGWRLDNLIFINDGSGNYNKYNKELKGPTGTFPTQFIPFINKDGNLSFYGTHVWDNQDQSALVNIWEITIKNL